MTKDQFFEMLRALKPLIYDEIAPEQERTIEADWLVEALSRDFDKIIIKFARIRGPLKFQSLNITSELFFEKCQFDRIIGRYSSFSKLVAFQGCRIDALDLRGSSFHMALWARNTLIENGLDMGYVNVLKELDIDGSHIHGRFYAANITIGHNFHLREAFFYGEVYIAFARVDGQLDLSASKFESELHLTDGKLSAIALLRVCFVGLVHFDRTTISSHMQLRNCTFLDESFFAGIQVRDQLSLLSCELRGVSHFEGTKATDLFVETTRFLSEASFSGTSFFTVNFSNVNFDGAVMMNEMKIDAITTITATHIQGNLSLERSSIGSTLQIRGIPNRDCVFHGEVSVRGSSIGAQMIIEQVKIMGDLIIESAKIVNDLFFENSFVCKSTRIAASQLGGEVNLLTSIFDGNVDFTNTRIAGNLNVLDGNRLHSLKLICTTISNEFRCKSSSIHFGIDANSVRIVGVFAIESATIGEKIILRMAQIGILSFDNSRHFNGSEIWRFGDLKIDLTGLRYDRIYVAWEEYLKALNTHCWKDDTQPFYEYERSLRRIGRNDIADRVHYEGKTFESQRFKPFQLAWLVDRLKRFFTGYGVRPFNLLRVGFIFFLISIRFFSIGGTLVKNEDLLRPDACNTPQYAQPLFDSRAVYYGMAIVVPGESREVDGWGRSECAIPFVGFIWGGSGSESALELKRSKVLREIVYARAASSVQASIQSAVAIGFSAAVLSWMNSATIKPYIFEIAMRLFALLMLPVVVGQFVSSLRYSSARD